MARLAGKTKISVDELRQTINLRTRLSKGFTVEDLEAFALEAIEQINQRTLDNQAVYGGSFAPYSKEYATKKGVSRGSVDLFLDGDMLDSLAYDIDEVRGTVEIFLSGEEAKKGYNHHKGDTLPRRPWFGVTTEEVESIVGMIDSGEAEDVDSGDTQVTTRRQDTGITLADLQAAIGQLFFEED